MNVVVTILQKVIKLPPEAQKEVLDLVEIIEDRYQSENIIEHPLTKIEGIHIFGPSDLSERHDFYANGKLED